MPPSDSDASPALWSRRTLLRASALTAGAMAAIALEGGCATGPADAATFRAPPKNRGSLTVAPPARAVWDFDDLSVTGWDTDVTAATASELSAAIDRALRQGTAGRPLYHRIVWKGGDVAGHLALSVKAPMPDKHGPHILVQGAGPTVIGGELRIGRNVTNVKFRGFRFQPKSTNFSKGKAQCVRLGQSGAGRRLAFGGCQFGAYWRKGPVRSYPEGVGGSFVSGWELALKDNECRGLFQLLDARAGWYHLEQNLVTGLVDDFAALTVRGVRDPAGQRLCYAYIVGNVVLDMADDPAFSGFHPDFVQCGTPSDAAGAAYHVQRYGNVYIGDTHRQYPTMNSIIAQNRGGATRFEIDTRDNVILCTGSRGMWLPDRRVTLQRDVMAWPPLDGPVPNAGKGWKGAPHRQHLRAAGGPFGRNSQINVGVYIAADRFQDKSGWGARGLDPVLIADPKAPLGGPTSYDTAFPNLTGLRYANGQVRIPPYKGPRTKAAVRAYVSRAYTPRTRGRGAGWEANGFNDPAHWFA